MPIVEQPFRAMNTDCSITVVDDDEANAQTTAFAGVALVHALEQLWSRFQPDSDISRINNAEGNWVVVDARTIDLLKIAIDAWRFTSGIFDISMLGLLERIGYDRTFSNMPELVEIYPIDQKNAVGMYAIEINEQTASVRVVDGVAIDFGGCGKGRIADLVVEKFRSQVTGMCIDLGGDIRVAGSSSTESMRPWEIHLFESSTSPTPLSLFLADGAVATSSTQKRSWKTTQGDRHHLLDPVHGDSAMSTIVLATAIASEAVWADIFAKVLVIRDDEWARNLLLEHGLSGRTVSELGVASVVGNFDFFSEAK